jgi:hypothetical protein
MCRSVPQLLLLAIAWDVILVLLLMPATPPIAALASTMGIPTLPNLRLYVYQSLFFHALALPLLAAVSYIMLLKIESKQLTCSLVAYSATVGFLLASIGGMTTILLPRNPITYGLFYIGLLAAFAAGVILLLGLWPHRTLSTDPASMMRGYDLPKLILWLCVASVLSATMIGGYAAMGSEAWGATASIPQFRLIRATHEHVIITIVDVAIVVLVAEHYRVRLFAGVRGLFGKLGYYSFVFGVPLVTITTYLTIPLGVEAHNAIEIFASVLLQGALFIMYAIFADFVVSYRRKNGGWARAFFGGVFGDPVAFGLLFIFFWVNIAVTLPGIYVAMNLSLFRGLPNREAFIIGHEHALITLTAVAILLFTVDLFKIHGWPRKFIGATTTLGYVLATGANVFYMFLDANPYGGVFMPYIQLGIILMLLGTGTGVAAMASALRKGVAP